MYILTVELITAGLRKAKVRTLTEVVSPTRYRRLKIVKSILSPSVNGYRQIDSVKRLALLNIKKSKIPPRFIDN